MPPRLFRTVHYIFCFPLDQLLWEIIFLDSRNRIFRPKTHVLPWPVIPLSTRVEGRWQIVWQGPRLGFAAETRRFVTTYALSTIFLFLPFSLSLFFSVLIPVCLSSSCCFVRAAVLCSSWARTCTFCVICILPHLRIPFVLLLLFVLCIFFVVLFLLLVDLLVVFSYPVR